MDKKTLEGLAERLAQATGPDRELDKTIGTGGKRYTTPALAILRALVAALLASGFQEENTK